MDHEEEDGPLIGARTKSVKKPNPLNEPKRQREAKRKEEEERTRAQPEGENASEEQQDLQYHVQPLQHESQIPSFGDWSTIYRDWTILGLFDDPIDQYEDTCASVVFTRLLQAEYNRGKPIAEHRVLSYKDLANGVKGKNKKKKFSFRNISIPINYIKRVGLHNDDKISGPGVMGVKTKGDFGQQEATRDFIYEKLEETPLGIVIKYFSAFEEVTTGIYYVPDPQTTDDEHADDHALLVVAKGRTTGG